MKKVFFFSALFGKIVFFFAKKKFLETQLPGDLGSVRRDVITIVPAAKLVRKHKSQFFQSRTLKKREKKGQLMKFDIERRMEQGPGGGGVCPSWDLEIYPIPVLRKKKQKKNEDKSEKEASFTFFVTVVVAQQLTFFLLLLLFFFDWKQKQFISN